MESEDGEDLQQLLKKENLIVFMRVLDMAQRNKRHGELLDPSKLSRCFYHEHKQTKPCLVRMAEGELLKATERA